ALGFTIDTQSYNALIKEKAVLKPFTIKKVPPLFPRVEEPLMPEAPKAMIEEPKKEEKPKKEKKESQEPETPGLITFDKFFETSLKIGTVVEAEEVPKSKKLLKLQVELGEEKPRQIVAGIKDFYSPDDLMNTQVCVVANLKPAKLMGILSEGMLLAAKDEDGLCLVRPESPRKAGSAIG
ncbi:MAG: methionine--tRNA ligase subunit beta, partial [Sulfurimonadaceae bacterium]|nr:methionine--tRNA ligase subunit beta [Sulfurimonadaceae bacterium]